VFLVLDGHPIHRSREVAERVSVQSGRLRLVFLPPYCPELNPVEYLNNAVKGGAPVPTPRDQVALAERRRLWLRVIQRRPHLPRRHFEAEQVRSAANPLSLPSRSGQ
jgi:transposase